MIDFKYIDKIFPFNKITNPVWGLALGWFIFTLPTIVHFPNIVQKNCLLYDSYLTCGQQTPLLNLLNGLFIFIVFVWLWFFYFKFLKSAESSKLQKNNLPILIILVCGLLMMPIGTFDLFYYLGAARDELMMGINPYVDAFTRINPFSFYYSNIQVGAIMYFPFWLFTSKFLIWLSGGKILLSVYLYKLLSTMFLIGCSYAIYLISKYLKSSNPLRNSLIFLLNPLMVFEFVVNGHIDAMMLFFMLIGFWFSLKKEYDFAILLMALSFLIKATPMFAIFIFVIWVVFHKYKDLRSGWLKLVMGGVASLFVTVLMFKHYWVGFAILDGLKWQTRWINNTPFSFIHSSISLVLNSLGRVELIDHILPRVIQGSFLILFLIFLFPITWKFIKAYFKKRNVNLKQVFAYTTIFYLLYYIFIQRSYLPWYAVIFLVFAAVINDAKDSEPNSILKKGVYLITFSSSMYYVIQAYWGYDKMGDLGAQIAASLVIFGPLIWFLVQKNNLTRISDL